MISRIIKIDFLLDKDYIKLNRYFDFDNLKNDAYNNFIKHLNKKISKEITNKLLGYPYKLELRKFTFGTSSCGILNNDINCTLFFVLDDTEKYGESIKSKFIDAILANKVIQGNKIDIYKGYRLSK